MNYLCWLLLRKCHLLARSDKCLAQHLASLLCIWMLHFNPARSHFTVLGAPTSSPASSTLESPSKSCIDMPSQHLQGTHVCSAIFLTANSACYSSCAYAAPFRCQMIISDFASVMTMPHKKGKTDQVQIILMTSNCVLLLVRFSVAWS